MKQRYVTASKTDLRNKSFISYGIFPLKLIKFPIVFVLQSFIRGCLAYRKEDRMDVFGLSRHEYLQPPLPKHGRQQQSTGSGGGGSSGSNPNSGNNQQSGKFQISNLNMEH